MLLSDGGLGVLWERVTGYVAAYCENIAARVEAFSESDPTVPSWAKSPSKPSYTYSEVGALSSATVIPSVASWALSRTKPSYTYSEVGALSAATSIPKVYSWALSSRKPSYTYSEVNALSAATVIPVVPSKVGSFSNDVGYITLADLSSMVATISALERRVSALEGGSYVPPSVTASVESNMLVLNGDVSVVDGYLHAATMSLDSNHMLNF